MPRRCWGQSWGGEVCQLRREHVGAGSEEPLSLGVAAAGEEVRSCPATHPRWETPLRSHEIKVLLLQFCISPSCPQIIN